MKNLLNLNAKEYLELATSDYSKISFAQLGEDIVLQHIFNNVIKISKGFYVDIGCNHPVFISNTFLFYLIGWSGLAIDASSECIDLFKKIRQRDISVWSGVGLENSEQDFFRFEDAAVSTLTAQQAMEWQTKYGWKLKDIIKVPVQTINSLLEKHLPAGVDIDYLNVDIEGLDSSVISQFDFSLFKPKVISIELHGVDVADAHSNEAVKLLKSKGYRLYAVCIVTYIFVLAEYF
jgi:hypothetical protein